MAPLLATSGGSVQGVPTNDDIFTAYENSNVTRTRGCFLGGSGTSHCHLVHHIVNLRCLF